MKRILLLCLLWNVSVSYVLAQKIHKHPDKIKNAESDSNFSNKKKYRKTKNHQHKVNLRLKRKKYVDAKETAGESFNHCDKMAAENAKGIIFAINGNETGAIYAFDKGLTLATQDRDVDGIYYNQSLAYLNSKDYNNGLLNLTQIDNPTSFDYLYYNRGYANFVNEEYTDAIEDYSKSIGQKKQKTLDKSHYMRGLSYCEEGDTVLAIKDFKKAVKLKSRNIDYRLALASTLSKKENFEEAKTHFRYVYNRESENIAAIMGLGNIEIEEKNYSKAIEYYSKVLDLEPKHYAANCGIADAQYYQRNFETAIEFYDKAIDIDEDAELAYVGRANAKSHLEEYTEAVEDYNKVLTLNPNNLKALEGKAIADFRLGYHEEAIEDFKKVLTLDSNFEFSYDAYISMGYSFFNLQNYTKAIDAFDMAIAENSQKATGYVGGGSSLYGKSLRTKSAKDIKDAIGYFNKALEIDSTNSLVYTNRGNAYYRLESYGQALSDFEKANQLNPKNAHALNGLGIVYHKWKADYSTAKTYIEKAIELEPATDKIYINLGITLSYLVADYQEADEEDSVALYYPKVKEANDSAQTFYGDSSVYYINMGYSHKVMEMPKKAWDYYNEINSPSYLKYAINNKGVLFALDNQHGKAIEYFDAAIKSDEKDTYASPRVNKALVSKKMGLKFKRDEKTGDRISYFTGRPYLDKDVYWNTYFYYTWTRYEPPPPEHEFKNELIYDYPDYRGEVFEEYFTYEVDKCLEKVPPKEEKKQRISGGGSSKKDRNKVSCFNFNISR